MGSRSCCWYVVFYSSFELLIFEFYEFGSDLTIGAPSKPQGSISFLDVLDITAHDDPSKCTNIKERPKKSGQYCLHLLTKDRTFNILGKKN